MQMVPKTREGHAYIPRATEGGAFSVTGALATPGTATPQGAYPLTLSKDKRCQWHSVSCGTQGVKMMGALATSEAKCP